MAEIVGLDKVARVFRTLPYKSQVRIRNALSQGADEIVDAAKTLISAARTPGTDPHHVRDTVQRSEIKVSSTERSAYVTITAGDTKETAQAAFRTEYGRDAGGDGVNAGHPGHKAKPFMFPAYWALRRRVRSRISREINRAVKEAAGLAK